MPFLLYKCILTRRRDPTPSPPSQETKGPRVWGGCASAHRSSGENRLSLAYKQRRHEGSEGRQASVRDSQGERSWEFCDCHNPQLPSASHADPSGWPAVTQIRKRNASQPPAAQVLVVTVDSQRG